MDPRDRADALLARARARASYVVTPEDAISPMDAANTQQIPRAAIGAAEHLNEGETTASIPAPLARGERPRGERPRGDRNARKRAQPMRQPQAQPTQLHQPQQRQAPQQPSQQPEWPTEHDKQAGEPKVEPARELDGIVPTVQQPSVNRTTLSQRLDGGS